MSQLFPVMKTVAIARAFFFFFCHPAQLQLKFYLLIHDELEGCHTLCVHHKCPSVCACDKKMQKENQTCSYQQEGSRNMHNQLLKVLIEMNLFE